MCLGEIEKQTLMGTHQQQSFHQALAFHKLLWEEPDQGLSQTGWKHASSGTGKLMTLTRDWITCRIASSKVPGSAEPTPRAQCSRGVWIFQQVGQVNQGRHFLPNPLQAGFVRGVLNSSVQCLKSIFGDFPLLTSPRSHLPASSQLVRK